MQRETPNTENFRPVPPVVTDDSGLITALFKNRHEAEEAFKFLRDRGYDERDVNVLMSEETRQHQFLLGPETELGNKAAKGAGVGAGIGGAVGAIAAVLATVGAVAVPGLGVVIAGPLAAALAGAGAGGAAGGLIGALIGAGIPEERVKHYESGLKSGGILLGVHPRTPEEALEIRHYWAKHGEHVYQ